MSKIKRIIKITVAFFGLYCGHFNAYASNKGEQDGLDVPIHRQGSVSSNIHDQLSMEKDDGSGYLTSVDGQLIPCYLANTDSAVHSSVGIFPRDVWRIVLLYASEYNDPLALSTICRTIYSYMHEKDFVFKDAANLQPTSYSSLSPFMLRCLNIHWDKNIDRIFRRAVLRFTAPYGEKVIDFKFSDVADPYRHSFDLSSCDFKTEEYDFFIKSKNIVITTDIEKFIEAKNRSISGETWYLIATQKALKDKRKALGVPECWEGRDSPMWVREFDFKRAAPVRIFTTYMGHILGHRTSIYEIESKFLSGITVGQTVESWEFVREAFILCGRSFWITKSRASFEILFQADNGFSK